ncbi:MAG: ion transporter [Akkermansiaceae bacterium]|nr:ion transporter [Akkermansiaceae bacterium]
MGEESGRKKPAGSFRERLWAIVFEAETPKGRAFDVALLWAIGLSVIAVMLESVDSIEAQWGAQLHVLEWCFTVVFSLEYVMRLWLVRRPLRYTFSFFGIVDLLSCLPSYLELFIPGLQTLLVIRILRLLRMFRVLKMIQHVRGADHIMRALVASRAKIMVFFLAVSIFAVLMGTLLYLVESGVEGTKFTNIPVSIYYTIITITTIGFGDIVTTTPVGMFLTAIAGLSGYAILAVPTGIVSAEMQAAKVDETTDACPSCGVHGHLYDAKFCRKCGERLNGG